MLAGRGRAQEHSALAKLRSALVGFAGLRPFIEPFASTVLVIAEVLKILKQQGLNQATYRHCRQLAEQLPLRSKVKKRVLVWLKRHLYLQCRWGIGQVPLLVSSDIIESLFGTFKHLIARRPQAELNRTVLVIPALCGQVDPVAIAQALAHTTHRDLERWEQHHVPSTRRQQRREFLPTKRDPKPGTPIPLKVP